MASHIPSQITLTGYYGFGNAGDEAIARSAVTRIRALFPDAELTVVTYPDGDASALARWLGVDVIDGADIVQALEAVRRSDLLLIGGGGLVHDYGESDPRSLFAGRAGNLSFWTSLAMAARGAEAAVATYNVGVGPLATEAGQEQARLLFEHVGLSIVRGEASAELLEEVGVDSDRIVVGADPAFLLEAPEKDPLAELVEAEDLPHEGSVRVAVAVRSWGDDPAWPAALAEGLDRLVDTHDADILFIPFQQPGRGLHADVLAASRVASRMARTGRRAVVGADLDPLEKLGALAHSDLVIGMRMHSAVFASAGPTPIVALAYDPKVRTAMRRLGLEGFVLDLDELTADLLVERATAALELPERRRQEMAEARQQLQRAVEQADWALADFAASPTHPVPSERAHRAMVTALAARASETAAAIAAREEALHEVWVARDQAANIQSAYDKIAAQYQTLLDARPVKAVRFMWKLRAEPKEALGLLGDRSVALARRVLPAPVRRAVRAVLPARGQVQPDFEPEELARYRAEIEKSLRQFVASHSDAAGFVVLPPGIGWDVDLFQRPQQMALAFARLGYAVVYHLEPRHRNGLVGYYEQAPDLLVGFIPEELADLLTVIPNPIFLSYVYNFPWRRHLDHPVTIYEHIDELEVFEHVYPRRDLERWHEEAVREAEVVAASAVDLLNAVKVDRPDAILVPNGVDYRHFADTDAPPPEDLEWVRADRPVVGYYGALAEWFDYQLLDAVAQRLPGFDFLLIGPDYDGTASGAPAMDRPNVHWIGARPYQELPRYLAAFDVATIPFVVNEVTHSVSPLKLFEYMAGGKPVVTPPLRECARYRAVQIGEGVEGFVEELRRAVELGKDPEHVALLRRTARANTWDARAAAVVEAVERVKA